MLARRRLTAHQATHGYHECTATPGLFRHTTRPITFTLVVDDFGIKCDVPRKEDVEHLHAALRDKYEITIDWEGKKYLGFTIDWTSIPNAVILSMPGYVRKALARFGIIKLDHDTDAPGPYVEPIYGKGSQLANGPDLTAPLAPPDILRIQQIVGVFTYYARAMDSTMMKKVNELASMQAEATDAVALAIEHFLQYAATWPDAQLVYYASDMILHAHSDASYGSENKARSRAAAIWWLGQHRSPDAPKEETPIVNGAIGYLSTILKLVVCSAAEAEYGALFLAGRELAIIRTTLADMGFPQPATEIQTDSSVATGVANKTITQQRTKAFDMRYHWIRDQVEAGHIVVTWRKGVDNLADYLTKNHSAKHHRAMRRFFVLDHTGDNAIVSSNRQRRSARRSGQHPRPCPA